MVACLYTTHTRIQNSARVCVCWHQRCHSRLKQLDNCSAQNAHYNRSRLATKCSHSTPRHQLVRNFNLKKNAHQKSRYISRLKGRKRTLQDGQRLKRTCFVKVQLPSVASIFSVLMFGKKNLYTADTFSTHRRRGDTSVQQNVCWLMQRTVPRSGHQLRVFAGRK